MNSIFLRALRQEPVERTPLWMMRQAGRYLPEYRALRQKAGSFLNLCRCPDWAAEVSLQPLRRFPLDAAIVFSDILVLPDVMGLGLHFVEGEGPRFTHPVQSTEQLSCLQPIQASRDLHYVGETIALMKAQLGGNTPIIGFAGSPWTVATYMIEGGSSKQFTRIKRWLYREPAGLHTLLQMVTDNTIEYLAFQVESGADAIMLFDTWGGVLSREAFPAFSVAYMKQIVQALKRRYPHLPVIVFSKTAGRQVDCLLETGAVGLGLDAGASLGQVRRQVQGQVALQGNLEPAALYAYPSEIRAQVQSVLSDFGSGTGHIFNLGHGIHPDTPIESVSTLVSAVADYSRAFHSVSV